MPEQSFAHIRETLLQGKHFRWFDMAVPTPMSRMWPYKKLALRERAGGVELIVPAVTERDRRRSVRMMVVTFFLVNVALVEFFVVVAGPRAAGIAAIFLAIVCTAAGVLAARGIECRDEEMLAVQGCDGSTAIRLLDGTSHALGADDFLMLCFITLQSSEDRFVQVLVVGAEGRRVVAMSPFPIWISYEKFASRVRVPLYRVQIAGRDSPSPVEWQHAAAASEGVLR